MKNYIFYSYDGSTQDINGCDTNNCQVIAWSKGVDELDAYSNLIKANKDIAGFDNIQCQELVSDKIYYF
ncbi:hypothetical protein [Francisella philomiragia]|uniref:hypothetical protein n=1 Tax=Francisella philomiragia TaxID=28110 RepID=UPI00351783AC